MVKNNYIPDRGDLIWIEFNPQSGHEQSGRRPALVISPREYNEISGLCILFPITSRVKGYPFEVKISVPNVSGVVLSDHIKSLDWKVRNAQFIGKASATIVQEVVDLFSTLIPL